LSEVNKELVTEQKDAICTITFNRPEKRNAVTPRLLNDLVVELKRLEADDSIKCVIITGAGEKAFSSGYDISAIGQHEDEMMRDYRGNHPLVAAVKAIEGFPYPVIAMINGHAFGGGLEIALTCDLRIATEKALFSMPPAKLGVIYTYTGIRRFINLIGVGHTKELFLLGRAINAERAQTIGLVNHVLPAEDLERFTYTMAMEIASNAPLSMKAMKEMINSWQKSQTLTPADEERVKELIMAVQESDDYVEGQKAFAEKRAPVFKGK